MTRQERQKIVDECLTKLGEHFDAVQVLACWQQEDGSGSTNQIYSGRGVWHARLGMTQHFQDICKSDDLSSDIARKLDPPDESEAWKK